MSNTNNPLTAEQAILTEMEGFWNEAQKKVWMPKLVRLIEQLTAALREELERSKERIDYYREAADKKDVTIQEMNAELEAVKDFFAKRPSGETKPASSWISVEEVPPVEGKDYNFIVDIPHSDYHGRVLGGKYIGYRFGYHEFATPGIGYSATLYCPIPVPPESLTDKTADDDPERKS